MATSDDSSVTVIDPKFINWMKTGLALIITKKEVARVVFGVIKLFQEECLATIFQTVPLHSYCPKEICDKLKSAIHTAHRYASPSYNNMDATQWYSNPWEIAKCYMPAGDYKGVKNAAETDLKGLISVIINHSGFDNVIKADLSEKNNIFEEVNRVVEAVRNSSKLEIGDEDLDRYFNILSNILTDPGFEARSKMIASGLGFEANATNIPSQKLKQLQKEDHFYIGGDVVRMLERNVIQTDTDNQHPKNQMLEIQNRIKAIRIQVNSGVKQQNEEFQSLHGVYPSYIQELFQEILKLNECNTHLECVLKELLEKLIAYFTSVKTKEYPSQIQGKCPNQIQERSKEMPYLQQCDGKLIKLNETQVKALEDNTVASDILKGGFGTVFMPKQVVPGLDVRVALKKITCKEDEHTKILSTYNENISRRIMHFAVVPLIGYMQRDISSSERVYYFLSPCLERGSLRSNLKQDFEAADVELKFVGRIKILFQIASAIKYLHTPVEGYRGIVLHMDITSSNIVLDENFDARLIDFGLARQLNEGQTNVTQSKRLGTPGYFQSQNYSKITVREDCYNFGVVIREVLTGKAPCITIKGRPKPDELRKQGEASIKKQMQKKIWDLEQTKVKKAADVLIELSVHCLKTDTYRDFSSENIVREIHKIKPEVYRCEHEKCDICIINQVVKPNVGLSPHAPHECHINVCISCMRNSNLNPIICPTCCKTVLPEIGHTFAALLIAGNDLKNPELAKSFTDDVLKIKEVLASKYPCVIGISPENIKVVAPRHPGHNDNDNLLDKISEAFECLKQKTGIKTLVLYYIGHYTHKDGFQLDGANETLTLSKLQENLKKFCKDDVKRVVAFLDCCYGPDIGNIPDITNDGVKIIQLNVCTSDKTTSVPTDGSLFRKFFVQALTRKVFNKRCFSRQETEGGRDCAHCEMAGPFISIGKLLEYISSHLIYMHKDRNPVLYVSDCITYKEDCIGYNIDFAACFEFKFQTRKEDKFDIKLGLGIYCDIVELKLSILKYLQDLPGARSKIPAKDYVECLSLQIDDGRQDGEELQTMLQISAAMDAGQCVIVSVRNSARILQGKVVSFSQTEWFYGYIKKRFPIKSNENTQKAYLSKDELDNLTEQLKSEENIQELNIDLTEVYYEWDKKENDEIEYLEISFPKQEDGNIDDYVVLDLLRVKNHNRDDNTTSTF